MKHSSLGQRLVIYSFALLAFAAPLARGQVNFSNLNVSLPGVYGSSAAWADYDNDGRLDFLLTGYAESGQIAHLYHNDGNGAFTWNTNVALPGVYIASVAWGDYDNDGRLDFLLTGNTGAGGLARLYHNDGNGAFTWNTNVALPGVYGSSVVWGDYDNDGPLDFLLTGTTGSDYLSRLYRNNGDGTFTWNTNAVLSGVYSGGADSADYDNDGRLDILLTGSIGVNYLSRLYRNNGDGTFTWNTNVVLPGYFGGSVAWGDYDNDGRPDFLLTGYLNAQAASRLYRNNGDGSFTWNTSAALPGVYTGFVAWGDYDSDGRVDLLLTGNGGANYLSRVYRNNGDGTFSWNLNAVLPGAADGCVAWGDYDNDGRLDLLLTGLTDSEPMFSVISRIYRNQNGPVNAAPGAPGGLSALVTGSGVMLGWSASTDPQTPAGGLTYNLRVGTTPGGSQIVFAEANSTNGFRRLPERGNAEQGLSATLTNLPPRTYYWSVQAVDSAYAGSPFAPEASFTISNAPSRIIAISGQPSMNHLLQFTGTAGVRYTLQASTNLANWLNVTNILANTNGLFQFTTTDATNHPLRFFRLSSP